MSTRHFRYLLPFVVFLASCVGYVAIAENAPNKVQKDKKEETLSVTAAPLLPIRYQVDLTSYGEVKSFETTQLSSQVSGTVTSRNKKFSVGGIIKRGEVLFSLDKGNYLAALSEAEAGLVSAEAALIKERALARVAARQARRMNKNKVTDLFLRKPQLLTAEAKVKSALSLLNRAKRDLTHCNVVAPFDALVVAKHIGVGQYVVAGTPLAILDNIERAEIHIPIAGFDAPFLPSNVAGLLASVTLRDIARDVKRTGQIIRDLGTIDSETRMTSLVVRLDDPYGLKTNKPVVKFGSFVKVDFKGTTLDQVYKLRQDLVKNDNIWVVNKEHKLATRMTKIIRQRGQYVFVKGEFEHQDQIVLSVPDYPENGTPVDIKTKITF
ncbi:efflux RND transporter periplasmic adaptor subunit [Veronia pacifica]|uniref:Efflux transporter periplasmic adaptor subunit n=1 Tax=Veronia pacifica TaxID=1080227 RepID=A0A1C3ECI6_9GAMM|nr:efflux RND transporter periplasmic adaptor subunit [Veronia pacifica]ODA30949.1 efflux transporter periplasmic adaptor subunit [Veronia pacifica]